MAKKVVHAQKSLASALWQMFLEGKNHYLCVLVLLGVLILELEGMNVRRVTRFCVGLLKFYELIIARIMLYVIEISCGKYLLKSD